jgi:predicted acylesterase/phospholipase RssA
VALNNSAPYGTVVEGVPPKSLLGRMLSAAEGTPIWQVVSTVSDIITARAIDVRHGVSRPDILLRPYIGTIGLFDFYRMDEGIEAGRQAFLEAEEKIKALLETERLGD